MAADNALLSQNFLMVQTRYRELVAQRDEERLAFDAHLRDAVMEERVQTASVSAVYSAIFASELWSMDMLVHRQKAHYAGACLEAALVTIARRLLSSAFTGWMLTVILNARVSLLTHSQAASLVSKQGKRRSAVIERIITSNAWQRDLGLLNRAYRGWAVAVAAVHVVDAAIKNKCLAGELQAITDDVRTRDRYIDAQRAQAAALQAEMRQLSSHAIAKDTALQAAELRTLRAVNEQDATAAKVADAQLQLQLLRNQLACAQTAQEKTDEENEKLRRLLAESQSELHETKAKVNQLQQDARGSVMNSQARMARMISDATELRRKLAVLEDAREKDRAQLNCAQTAYINIHGELAVARAAAARGTAAQQHWRDMQDVQHAANIRAQRDSDAQLAFNADLVSFASRLEVKPLTCSSSRLHSAATFLQHERNMNDD